MCSPDTRAVSNLTVAFFVRPKCYESESVKKNRVKTDPTQRLKKLIVYIRVVLFFMLYARNIRNIRNFRIAIFGSIYNNNKVK